MVLILAPIFLIGAASSYPVDAPVIADPPPNFQLFTPGGVDYEARMRVAETMGGKKLPWEIQVLRSGSWIVERRNAGTGMQANYSDLASGSSFDISIKADNSIGGMAIFRNPASGRGVDIRRIRTGDRKKIAGENCTVWRSKLGQERIAPIYMDCITADGVDLEARVGSSSGNMEFRSARAIKVIRRRVSAQEVRPPAKALDWANWRNKLGVLAKDPRNFEVRLESANSKSNGRKVYRIVRRFGGGRYQEDSTRRGLSVFLITPAMRVSYQEDIQGRAEHLEIWPNNNQISRDGAVSLNSRETIAGEHCTWFNTSPNVSDVSSSECRTADGIPLASRESSWGSQISDLRAVYVKRGKLMASDLSPPAKIFDWKRWLSPHLPLRD